MGLLDSNVVRLRGGTLAESTQDESDASGGVHTFAAPVAAIEIVNQGSSGLEATVNGITIVVPPGLAYGPALVGGTASASVSVTASGPYLLARYE